MANFSIHHIKISGMACGVPALTINNYENPLLPETERALFIKTTGVEKIRRAAGKSLTELTLPVAQALLKELGWQAEDIGLIIFVTQTPDYPIPPAAIIMQNKLGLPTSALAFDINLGCSGYVYGLSVAASLLQTSGQKKALLCVGDISSACISETDKSTAPLFSDAVSVTALEKDPTQPYPMIFNLQSDGAGYKAIIIPDGGSKNPLTPSSLEDKKYGADIIRKDIHMALDGIKVFNFSLREVAANLEAMLKFHERSKDDFDYFVFHQANLLMNESIRKKLKLPPEKMPSSLKNYGNTSSASIPITIVTEIRSNLLKEPRHLLLSGFGVGLSWGSAGVYLNQAVCLPIIEVI